jgi:hypothetical protein
MVEWNVTLSRIHPSRRSAIDCPLTALAPGLGNTFFDSFLLQR